MEGTVGVSRKVRNRASEVRVVSPCAGCGVVRQARPGVVLCADCRFVLSKPEREAWS